MLGNPDLNPVYWSSDPSGGPFDNPQAAVVSSFTALQPTCYFSTLASTKFTRCRQDYLAFFSLTANVNIYNLKAAAAAGGDAQDPFYFAAPIDCEYKDYSSSENNGTSDDGCAFCPPPGARLMNDSDVNELG